VKIAIVSQSYYPRYGGVTEHVHHTAVELRKRGHDVKIVTSHFRSGESNHTAGVERVGYNLLIPFNKAFVDVTVGLRLRGRLRDLYREHDFDLVHVHQPTSPSLPIIAVQAASCPVVGTFHTTAGRSMMQDAFQPLLQKVVEKLDGRIAVSTTAAESARLYYPGDYRIIPNGVEVERFHPLVPPFSEWREPGRLNLLFVGRLDPRKGLDVLIAAMPEIVRRTGGRARLLVVGDSFLRPRYEASIPAAARDHVRFLGHVPSRDLARWYATGDIFVSPATGNESFGIVLAEAMAAGRAVIASDIPGYRTVVTPNVDGVCVPPGRPDLLADAVARLAAEPERRAARAACGRARALEFAWPRVTEQIESVYRDVVARRSTVHTAA
jgi:phosphatidylinositol alpha-mannosyltransferase